MLTGTRGKDPTALEEELIAGCKTNVVGTIHLFNLFLPLILNGQQKKVVFISSGQADLDLISKYEIEVSGPYAVGKAATNTVVAKFGAEYARDGVLFMSISPGVVETGHFNPAERKLLGPCFPFRNSTPRVETKLIRCGRIVTEKESQSVDALTAKFQKYAPHFQGPITPEASVKAVISVYEKASLANGDGGSFVSHLGTKRWL